MKSRAVPAEFTLAVAIDAVGSGVFLPVSLLFFTRVSDLSLPLVGALTNVGTLVSLPVPVLVGHLADRRRPRDLVIAGQVLQAAGFAGYLLARDPVAVCLVIATVAVGQRVFWSSFFTMIAALPADGDRDGRIQDRRFALVGMLQNAGYGVGALTAGAVVATASTTVYLLAAALNAATFLASATLLLRAAPGPAMTTRADGPRPAGYRALLGDRPYLLLIVANTAFAVCSVFLSVGLPVFVIDGLHAPGWIVGVVLAFNTLLLSVGQLAATRLVRPLSRVGALILAGALWICWGLLTAAAVRVPTGWLGGYLILVVALFTAAELIHAPVSNALAAEAAPAGAQGSYLAAFQYSFVIANMVVPAAFTFLFGFGAALPWIILAGIATAGTALMSVLRSRFSAATVHRDDGVKV